MVDDAPGRRLEGFSVAARRAVSVAADEARALGHERLGTEHLLLGLLLDADSHASRTLTTAGVTVAAVRKKVGEAVAAARARGARPPVGALAFTARAERAIGRSSRFAHQQRSHAVEPEHLLLGVLDVEGTAGQVLRGLGIDVSSVRVALEREPGEAAGADADPSSGAVVDAAPTPSSPVRCGSCGDALDEVLTWRPVTASSLDGADTRDAVIWFCRTCGTALSVSPVRRD
ncbi:MAG TPA: Clp protease N-terminal domain-containing protein [Acidimicrobiales bacterium]|nr:Clp protease N-terminal domain-containing protein [Acidimicrobiales bacterium]